MSQCCRSLPPALFGLALACADSKDETREGPAESDPYSVYDTARPDPEDSADSADTGTGTPGGIRWEDLPADAADEVVCYPGPALDDTVCLPTVAWSAEWGASYVYPEPLDGDPQYTAPVRFLDLYDPELASDLSLAPNFVLGEFMQDYKGRFALFQPHAVSSLQTLRDQVGGPIYLNSAYRNVDYNAGVGGATWSRHMYGDAVDMRSDNASLEELAALCADLGAGFTSVYTSHVHCDWRDSPLDPAFFDVPGGEAMAHASDASPSARVVRQPSGTLLVEPIGFDEGTPRIRWTARDEAGLVVEEATGLHWEPVSAAQRVELDVGGVLRLQVPL